MLADRDIWLGAATSMEHNGEAATFRTANHAGIPRHVSIKDSRRPSLDTFLRIPSTVREKFVVAGHRSLRTINACGLGQYLS